MQYFSKTLYRSAEPIFEVQDVRMVVLFYCKYQMSIFYSCLVLADFCQLLGIVPTDNEYFVVTDLIDIYFIRVLL